MTRRIPLPASLRDPHWVEVVRIRYQAGDAYDEHDHDFAEVFWIEDGTARHHCNGQDEVLRPGDLTILRPQDRHAFATCDARGFTMVNVVIRPQLIGDLRDRLSGTTSRWPWPESGPPQRLHLGANHLDRLQTWADDLASDTSRLAAEGFLIEVARRVEAAQHAEVASDVPPWLARTIERFAAGEGMSEGAAAFRRMSGRCSDHLNRVVQQHFHVSATDLINRLRLEHAARLLRLGGHRILAVAEACGFASLPHFYRAFHAHYGQTPRAFRRSLQAVGRGVPTRPGPRPVATTRPRR